MQEGQVDQITTCMRGDRIAIRILEMDLSNILASGCLTAENDTRRYK